MSCGGGERAARWPLGMNLMLWTDRPAPDAATRALLARLAGYGYGGVEVPLLDLDRLEPRALGALCDDLGLWRTANTALPQGTTFLRREGHAAALAWIARACVTAATLGAPLVCGPLCAPVGELPGRPGRRELDACVEGLAAAGAIAAKTGVVLALEPINRFESCVATTAADAARLVRAAGNPGLRLMLDTFHMNVEERRPEEAIAESADLLVHVHASENDRGPCGAGHVAWRGVFGALGRAGYAGRVVVESFGAEVPQIARACCIWRALAPSADDLARESAEFLLNEMGKA